METEQEGGGEEQGVDREKPAPKKGGRGQRQGRLDEQGIGEHPGQGAGVRPGEDAESAFPGGVRKKFVAERGGSGEEQEREGYEKGQPPEQVRDGAAESLSREEGRHQDQRGGQQRQVQAQQDLGREALRQEQSVGVAADQNHLVEEQADGPDIVAAAIVREDGLPGQELELEKEERAEESGGAEE